MEETLDSRIDALYKDFMEALAKQDEQIRELQDICNQALEAIQDALAELEKLADNKNYE